MKRRIVSTNYKLDALKAVYKDAVDSGLRAEINRFTHCVDILDGSGWIIEQRYPRKGAKVKGTRNDYQYVGPNNGDYKKVVRVVNEQTYNSAEPYVKYVYKTNDPSDGRSVSSLKSGT